MAFINDNFILKSEAARKLYSEYADGEPIFDYHCHLSPQEIAENRKFSNLTEIWLEGDHYKWRAMRTNGIDERFCTGDASPYEKFEAFCKTVPNSLRNPLYHWSHLELARYFGIDCLINEANAQSIWDKAQEQFDAGELTAHKILEKFKVKLVGTTDDPVDSLEYHIKIKELGIDTKVVPTFRPDKALNVDAPEAWNTWCSRLAEVSNSSVSTFDGFLSALKSRHDFFHEVGGRASDHGLERCFFAETSKGEVASIYDRAQSGQAASEEEKEAFAFYVMWEVARWNAEKDWVMQLHLGAMRDNNMGAIRTLGPDTGYDSIGDYSQGVQLSAFLDSLGQTNEIPKVVLYNLNPADNYLFATMAGNFQDGSMAGKIQFGSGWWFLDQKEAMEWQMNALSNLGLLSHFIGMLTDSRSFMSYCRHEYFRRILCNLLGEDITDGEIPEDYELVGRMVKNICYGNAERYFDI